jgi:hypothetical protein
MRRCLRKIMVQNLSKNVVYTQQVLEVAEVQSCTHLCVVHLLNHSRVELNYT